MYFQKDNIIKRKAPNTDIINFLEQLGTLIKSDISIINALDILKKQFKRNKLLNIIIGLSRQIQSGKDLSEAMEISPRNFPPIITEQVKLAEETGELAKMLISISKECKKIQDIKKNLKKAVAYPTFMLVSAIILAAILLVFVLPEFQEVFSEFNAQLPTFTQALINLSKFIQAYFKILLLFLLISYLSIKTLYKKHYKTRYTIDFLLLKTPIIQNIIKNNLNAQFAQTIHTTSKANIPLDKALILSANIIRNSVISKEIKTCVSKIKSGESLSNSLINYFSEFLVQMVQIGEKTGNLQEMMQKASQYHQTKLKDSTNKFQKLLEPTFTLMIGGTIGAFVIGMYLPIFQLGNIL